MSIILRANNIGKMLSEGQWLFREIFLSVKVGDQIALIGRTGVGKTSLLKLLCHLDQRDEGEIYWRGVSITTISPPLLRSAILYLHQKVSLPNTLVDEALKAPFSWNQYRERKFPESWIQTTLSKFGFSKTFLKQPCKNLSVGQAQIVALLRALVLSPKVLLLDEPTAHHDQETVDAIEKLVFEWVVESRFQRAFIWITHDHQQVRRISSQVWRMRGSQLETCPKSD